MQRFLYYFTTDNSHKLASANTFLLKKNVTMCRDSARHNVTEFNKTGNNKMGNVRVDRYNITIENSQRNNLIDQQKTSRRN